MKKITISAKVPAKDGNPELTASITVDAPETAKEAIEVCGDEAVLSNALANWVVGMQSNIRSGLKKGETQEQIQARLASARMGVTVKGATVDPVQAFLARFASATPEEQKSLMAELKAKAKNA